MNEFEDRLTDALRSGAEHAPTPPHLAERARRRLRARRRRTAQVVAATVVLVALVPLGIVSLDRGADRSDVADPVPAEVDDGWRRVTRDGLTFEVPGAWAADQVVGACPPTAKCLSAPDTVTLDPNVTRFVEPRASQDGVWSARAAPPGAGVGLDVRVTSRAVAQRIVDSAYGGCAPQSRISARDGEEPGLDRVGVVEGATVCSYRLTTDTNRLVATRRLDAAQTLALITALRASPGDVQVSRPCGYDYDVEAIRIRLGDLEIWINEGPDCAPQGIIDGSDVRELTDAVRAALASDGWQTVEHEGVEVDVPGGWERVDTSSCEFEPVSFGPPDLPDPCDQAGTVSFYGSATFDPATFPGLVENDDGTWGGYVYAGDWAVYVGDLDRATTLAVLGTARRPGDVTGDPVVPWVQRQVDGVEVEVPGDVAIEVDVAAGYPDCSTPLTPAVRLDDGRWRAGHCVDRVVRVTAPTQALADLVASTVVSDLD